MFRFTVFRLLGNVFVYLLPPWNDLIISPLCRTYPLNFPLKVYPLSVFESFTLRGRHNAIAPLENYVRKCIKAWSLEEVSRIRHYIRIGMLLLQTPLATPTCFPEFVPN